MTIFTSASTISSTFPFNEPVNNNAAPSSQETISLIARTAFILPARLPCSAMATSGPSAFGEASVLAASSSNGIMQTNAARTFSRTPTS